MQGFSPTIVQEFEKFFVVNKPSGIHSTNGKDSLSPKGISVEQWAKIELGLNDIEESGLINRLDFYTSGIILIAKDRSTQSSLKNLYREKQVIKSYKVLVEGKIKKTIDLSGQIGAKSRRGRRVYIADSKSKKKHNLRNPKLFLVSITPVNTPTPNSTYLNIKTRYGFRHIIRATCSHLGHPLVGDSIYNSQLSLESFIKSSFEGFTPNFFLVADSLKFSLENKDFNLQIKLPTITKFISA